MDMARKDVRTYRIREFADLAGVSVRALHHYDRLGLITPKRTASGYRKYSAKDLETLEQIVALKLIGLSLKDIKVLLRQDRADLARALRAQRITLEAKCRHLRQAIVAISEAERALADGRSASSAVLGHIIEVIEMTSNRDKWKEAYEVLMKGENQRLQQIPPAARTALRARFADLFKEMEPCLDEDPASPRVQALADRCIELMQPLRRNGDFDPQLLKCVAAYLSSGEWPADADAPQTPSGDNRAWAFIAKALAIAR